MRRAHGWVALLLVAALGLAGCGIGGQSSAQRIPQGGVPFDLLAPAPLDSGSDAPTAEAVILYFLQSGRLVAVARELPAPASVNARLAALAAGPTRNEAASGLSSAVSALGASPSGTIDFDELILNLTPSFQQLSTSDQVEALAQLVYTATAIPGITSVSFRIHNKPVAVPRQDNRTTRGSLTRSDYGRFAPVIP